MHSVTDKQTDKRQDYANSRSYCIVVRSAKNAQRKLSHILSEMESSRPWPWPRGASRTTGHVLGLGLGRRVLGLGLGKHVLGLDHFYRAMH